MCENLVEQVDELLGQMNIDELTQVIKNAEQFPCFQKIF